jgi:hypothetical protein
MEYHIVFPIKNYVDLMSGFKNKVKGPLKIVTSEVPCILIHLNFLLLVKSKFVYLSLSHTFKQHDQQETRETKIPSTTRPLYDFTAKIKLENVKSIHYRSEGLMTNVRFTIPRTTFERHVRNTLDEDGYVTFSALVLTVYEPEITGRPRVFPSNVVIVEGHNDDDDCTHDDDLIELIDLTQDEEDEQKIDLTQDEEDEQKDLSLDKRYKGLIKKCRISLYNFYPYKRLHY